MTPTAPDTPHRYDVAFHLRRYTAARSVLSEALTCLRKTAPLYGDFRTRHHSDWAAAQDEHEGRVNMLAMVLEELDALCAELRSRSVDEAQPPA